MSASYEDFSDSKRWQSKEKLYIENKISINESVKLNQRPKCAYI